MKEGRFWSYLKYAAGEVVLVVIGILIALQVNKFTQTIKERNEETRYLRSIVEDVKLDIINNEEIIDNATSNKQAALNLLMILESSAAFEDLQFNTFRNSNDNDTITLMVSLGRSAFMMLPQVYDNTFEDLKSSGNTSLITDLELRRNLYRYYGTLDRIKEWNYIKRDAHADISRLMAEILPYNLRSWSHSSAREQDSLWTVSKPDPNPIIEQIRQTPDLLPVVNNMIYTCDRLIMESEMRISLARRMLEHLQAKDTST